MMIAKTLIFFLKVINRVLLRPFLAKKEFQEVYRKLYVMGLYGMNYGRLGGVQEEKAGLEHIKKVVKTKSDTLVFFDVGANIGEYSQLLAEVFQGEKFKVHAFEPSSIAFKELCKNVISANVNKINKGLGKIEAVLWLKNAGSKIASVVEENELTGSSNFEKIQITTIDTYCELNAIYHIDLLKIDVEGYEYEVLEGCKELISKGGISFIQFEFGYGSVLMKSGKYFKDYCDLLINDYNIYRIVKDGLVPVPQATIFDEIFLGANFLACSKAIDNPRN